MIPFREADLVTLKAVHEAATGGRHLEAATLARAALADGLEHPLLYNVVALDLELAGDVAEAAKLLERAVRHWPNDAGARNALGLCLLRLERPAEALIQFDALLALDPKLPFAHASRGAALLALGRLAAAEASYRRVLEFEPKHVVALAGLAHAARSRGAYADARRCAQDALALLPGFPDAVLSLASAELADGDARAAEARLRELLARPALEPLDRADAQGLLGDVLDAEGRTGEAFAAYRLCNEEQQRHYRPRFGAEHGARDYAEGLLAFFDSARPEDWRAEQPGGRDGSGAVGHAFLLGFPRCGTTLLEVALEGHPGVVALEEQETLLDAVNEYMQEPAGLERLRRAPPGELERLRAAYWKRVTAHGVDVAGRVFVDKHPLNTLKLPLIARLFPSAKIVEARRDPRDVVLSCFRRRFRMSAPIYELLTLEGAARYYDVVMRLAARFEAVLPLAKHVVRYETLVADFPAELARLCAFLRLEPALAMADFATRVRNRASATPSTAQLARGLDRSGVGSWRRYEGELGPVLGTLAPWVHRFGYAT
jgi:tetratricopeptide (TPR) repeat protein